MKFAIVIYQDEDSAYIAECPAIPGCISQGRTAEEAEANVREAIRECLEVRRERGMPLSVAMKEIEVQV
ncbi:MAG TPA: type II toxin-antitoxin system HicB family antitoxin [Gemmatimonadota bacterium]|nr:type II toxin-antitoxin system HicB family antitoxin [Gemmatimonadota bacterium]